MGRPMMTLGAVFCLLVAFCLLLPSFLDAGTSAASTRDGTTKSKASEEVEKHTLELMDDMEEGVH